MATTTRKMTENPVVWRIVGLIKEKGQRKKRSSGRIEALMTEERNIFKKR